MVALIVALVLPILLLFTGLVVDVGTLYWHRAQAQSAADAGALAAAAAMPGNAVEAFRMAGKYVSANLPTASEPVVTPHFGGDPATVEVRVTEYVRPHFAAIFGVYSVAVRARAVATRDLENEAESQTATRAAAVVLSPVGSDQSQPVVLANASQSGALRLIE